MSVPRTRATGMVDSAAISKRFDSSDPQLNKLLFDIVERLNLVYQETVRVDARLTTIETSVDEVAGDALLLNSGDHLLLNSGDFLLLNSA